MIILPQLYLHEFDRIFDGSGVVLRPRRRALRETVEWLRSLPRAWTTS
jgi:hypothetical protein